MTNDLLEIKAQLASITPGDWHHCTGECKCTGVWSDHHPVAEVTKGDWGDEYPALGPIKDGFMSDASVEAYMKMHVYGHVEEKEALSNRHFIASAPKIVRDLIAEIEELRERNASLGWQITESNNRF